MNLSLELRNLIYAPGYINSNKNVFKYYEHRTKVSSKGRKSGMWHFTSQRNISHKNPHIYVNALCRFHIHKARKCQWCSYISRKKS